MSFKITAAQREYFRYGGVSAEVERRRPWLFPTGARLGQAIGAARIEQCFSVDMTAPQH